MLKDSLYTIQSSDQQENTITATLALHTDNPIFAGHFPGQPVLPGACMLQIVKEVLEYRLNRPLQMKRADHIKFISAVDPSVNNVLKLALSYKENNNGMDVTASIASGETVCCKLKGYFSYTDAV